MVPVALGVVIGTALGALGGGGSILTVPALVYLVGMKPYEATTASLVIVGVTALTGTLGHHRHGRVAWRPGLVFGVLGVAGSYVGSRASRSIDPDVLLLAFAGLMLVAAAAMVGRLRAGRSDGPHGDVRESRWSLDGPIRSGRVAKASRTVAAATAVGLLTGFFGVGGGFVVVPALVLALGFATPVAVGTSLLVIAVNSASGLAVRLGSAELDWAIVGPFTAAAVLGSLAGSRVAGRVRPETLTRAFVALLVAVTGYVTVRGVAGL